MRLCARSIRKWQSHSSNLDESQNCGLLLHCPEAAGGTLFSGTLGIRPTFLTTARDRGISVGLCHFKNTIHILKLPLNIAWKVTGIDHS